MIEAAILRIDDDNRVDRRQCLCDHAWAGGQRYAVIWSGDQSGNWEYIRFHIPTVIGAGLSGYNAATGDVDGIFGGSAQTQVRDLQWKALTPAWMIISGWSKQTNNMKQPWIFGEPYTSTPSLV